MPRILFVAMAESVHTTRWISQVNDLGWEIYLFPVYRYLPHPDLRNITFFGSDPFPPANLDHSVKYVKWPSFYFYRELIEVKLLGRKSYILEKALKKVIQKIKPDLIHTLEFQHSAYLTVSAKKLIKKKFPTWIATNWGSDIFLYGRLKEHIPKIKEVLANCDYYSAECQRDVELALQMGFTGKVLPVQPNGGGYDLEFAGKLKQTGSTSSRKKILLKGYQTWAGRALNGLSALKLCKDHLNGYEIFIYMASPETQIAAELFGQETGIPVIILPKTSHEEILRLHGQARISIGLSISDAISTSLLEAMVMGSFPIQSGTACANEWIIDGVSGFIVPPDDPQEIANSIIIALENDSLVDSAAAMNAEIAKKRLRVDIIKNQVINMYQEILNDIKAIRN